VAEIAKLIENGIDPAEVAARVVSAIRRNELCVFTHLEVRDELEKRYDTILQAYKSLS